MKRWPKRLNFPNFSISIGFTVDRWSIKPPWVRTSFQSINTFLKKEIVMHGVYRYANDFQSAIRFLSKN